MQSKYKTQYNMCICIFIHAFVHVHKISCGEGLIMYQELCIYGAGHQNALFFYNKNHLLFLKTNTKRNQLLIMKLWMQVLTAGFNLLLQDVIMLVHAYKHHSKTFSPLVYIISGFSVWKHQISGFDHQLMVMASQPCRSIQG